VKIILIKIINQLNKFMSYKILKIIILMIALSSCANSVKYGKISLHSTGERDSFIFTISEEFLEKNYKKLGNEVKNQNVKISKIEFNLLQKLLKEKKFCINEDNDLAFEITSRQEKIYDMTFSHLIATSYKARPLSPRSYFGECVKKITK
jgi:hypothetical protein